MKIPSIHYLTTQAASSFLRFPLTILASVIAVIQGVYLVEFGDKTLNIFPEINLMLCMSIGIPLYFCVTIVATKKMFSKNNIIFANLLATVLLVAIYFTLPNSNDSHYTSLPYVKYGLYNVTCHLLVSIAPFLFNKQLNGFWNYNKILFLRILLSLVYSIFIYLGLIIALTALKLLFDIEIHQELYLEIWIATIGIFNTWFFVSGIPADFDQLEDIKIYPKGLKIFAQYVLLPLLGLYLIILYAYGAKIIISTIWPKGVVAYLIIFISILGIFTFLLLYPYGNLKESLWIKKLSRIYYFALIPLLFLLYIAIYIRINEYGVTINRYAILMLAIWITIVCVYSVLGKTNIKFIPTSLAIIMIFISFGPWGMFSFSENSQTKRLKLILEESKILVDNKIQNEPIWVLDSLPKFYAANEFKNEGKLKDSKHNEVKSIIEYLNRFHGFSSIKPWYKQDINSIIELHKKREKNKDFYYIDEPSLYIKSLGLKDIYIPIDNKMIFNDYSVVNSEGIILISGYDYLFDIDSYSYDNNLKLKSLKIEDKEFELSYLDVKKNILVLKIDENTFKFQLDVFLEQLKKEFGTGYKTDIPLSAMKLTDSNDLYDVKIQFNSIQTESKKNRDIISNFSGHIFIKKK